MKKLFTLLTMLVLVIGSMWAQTTTTATYGKSNGTFYDADDNVKSGGFDAVKFVTNSTPAVTIQVADGSATLNSADAASGARLGLSSGTNKFTISVPDNYIIVSYSFNCKAVQTAHPGRTLTTESGTTLTIPSGNNSTRYSVSETYVNKQRTYFIVETTGWSPINTYNFTITVRKKFYEGEITAATDLEDGYYVVQGRANSGSGFWYHDRSLSTRYFRMSTTSTSSPDLTSFTGNLKYVWKLTKDNENGTFTLKNVDTEAYAPADEGINSNFTGSTPANFSWDSEHAAIKQTNFTDGDGLYVHCNRPGGDMNLSYWNSGPGSNVNIGSNSLVAPRFFKVSDANVELAIAKKELNQKISEVNDFKEYLGDGIGKYTTSNAGLSDIEAEIEKAGTLCNNVEATEPEVRSEIEKLASYIENRTINQPTDGFYRFHIDNKYMCGIAGNDNVRTATETNNDASSIFYLNEDNYLISYLDGYGFNYGYCKATSPGIFNNFDFSESTLLTKYNIHSNAGTGDSQWSDRNITINTSDNKLAEGQGTWAIEPVTSLPVTLKASALGYATFCCPVPVKIPSGVEAFVSKIEDNTIKLFRIENFKDAEENVVIPANTAVMLHNKNFNSIDETFSFEIAEYSGEGITDNGFDGTIAAESMVAGNTYYSLRTWKVNDVPTKVGFATKTSGSLAGFKAWICEEGQSARNFTIVFDSDSDPTGIVEALGLEDANVEIYDLNGRKLSSYKRGINIVNGKKVMVK